MKIAELLAEKPVTLSFEVFPPKTDAAFEPIQAAVHDIARLKPDFMSVTYGRRHIGLYGAARFRTAGYLWGDGAGTSDLRLLLAGACRPGAG